MTSLAAVAEQVGAEPLAPSPGCASQDPQARATATAVADVDHDSRRVAAGALFACIPGRSCDGHDFAADAVAAGAVALLVERPIRAEVPRLLVPSVRAAVGPAAAAVHGHPSERLDLVGVTGTNGKTTTVRLLARLLTATGRATTEIGTLTGSLTTPEATDLQRSLSVAVARGVDCAAIEVSSHALVQHRVDGCRFRVAAFTNLGHDHLDFHPSMEDYFSAKARLFTGGLAERAVVDVTGEWGRRLAEVAASELEVVKVDQREVAVLDADAASSVFRWRGRTVRLPMPGPFNRANAVLAAEVAVVLGLSPQDAADALAGAAPVPGRFEGVQAGQDFAVVVDYAHTPDALAAVLEAARSLGTGELTVVFGAGGDRDPAKRPQMGATAQSLADRVIVTSDNPRTEDPDGIIADIVAGMSGAGMSGAAACCEPDRRLAIRHAVASARSGDVVVIAGKGHETSQVIGGRTLPFDDREVARAELEALASRQAAADAAGGVER